LGDTLGTGHRILIVDDERAVRALLRQVLVGAGYEVEEADGGEAGLARVAAQRPDLILLDMAMPVMNGWGVLRQLQEQPSPPPVVTMSGGYVSPAGLGKSKCVYAYVLKPLRMDALLRTVAVAIGRGSVPAPPVDAERRRAMRRSVVGTVTLVDGSGKPIAVGYAVNLTRVGLEIHLGANLTSEQTLHFILQLPKGDGGLELHGTVRWSRDGAVGLDLVDVGDETAARLDEFLRKQAEPSPFDDSGS
jgi:CheY-like chemotaxis protein